MRDLLLIGFAGLVFALGIVLLVDFFAPRPSWDETEAWERARRATGGTDE